MIKKFLINLFNKKLKFIGIVYNNYTEMKTGKGYWFLSMWYSNEPLDMGLQKYTIVGIIRRILVILRIKK